MTGVKIFIFNLFSFNKKLKILLVTSPYFTGYFSPHLFSWT